MVKNTETFKSNLESIKDFLAEKRMLSDLAENVGVSDRLVQQALSVNSFDELTGKKLKVYEAAIEMVEKIKNLPDKAKEVLNF